MVWSEEEGDEFRWSESESECQSEDEPEADAPATPAAAAADNREPPSARATHSPSELELVIEGLESTAVEEYPPYAFSPGEGQLVRSQGRAKVARASGETSSAAQPTQVRRSIF